MTTSKSKDNVRTKRVPIAGQRDIMTVEGLDTENYVHRWVNDKGVRVDQFKAAGYEPVEQDGNIMLGAASVQSVGSVIKVITNQSTGEEAILMRIRKEWYDEDQAAKAEELAKSEEAMFRQLKEADGRYGSVKVE
jgi:hypothetical protein